MEHVVRKRGNCRYLLRIHLQEVNSFYIYTDDYLKIIVILVG